MFVLAAIGLVFAAIPAALFLANLSCYRRTRSADGPLPAVSILIPARNEERSLPAAIDAVRKTCGIDWELIILDDHSTDQTADIVRKHRAKEQRIRLEQSRPLPAGWCGKQHACYQLGELARHPLLLFLDADVRLEPDGAARLAAFHQSSRADLVSGIPRQETGSLLEKLVVPLIHWLLLGYLPMVRMRRSRSPAYGAGCGQLFLTHRAAYDLVGGHAAVRESMHDGIMLPRAYRAAGLQTDLCDATDLATCRMYTSAGAVWNGFAKNAREGMAAPIAIWVWTALLTLGHVLPFALLAIWPWLDVATRAVAVFAGVLSMAPRLIAAKRFRQSWLGAMLHPLGVASLLAIQWYAATRAAVGKPIGWKGRVQEPVSHFTHSLTRRVERVTLEPVVAPR